MAEYAVDEEITAFFTKSTATKDECEAKCRELTNSDKLEAVPIQGACSYTLYGGDDLEYVLQCRLKSLELNMDISKLARQVHAGMVPEVSFHGQLGDEQQQDGREPLLVYRMTRMEGMTMLDFVLARGAPQSSPELFPFRATFFAGVGSFFAQSWLAPQPVSAEYRIQLEKRYRRDLILLHDGLPARFRPCIRRCLTSLRDIIALPMVLLHKDFGVCNVLINPETGGLKGVVDWAEAEIGPFGTNLHSLQAFAGSMHLRNGWSRFPDYDACEHAFWSGLDSEVGALPREAVNTIKRARILGLLLSHGFTSRLANEAEPVPLKDDDYGRYQMTYLDAFLINPTTKLEGAD